MQRVVGGLVLAAAMLVMAACGTTNNSSDVVLGEAEDVVRQLRSAFIDSATLTDDALNRAAIEGILEYIDDPYTSYLAPPQFTEFSESLGGSGDSFEGIGAEVTIRNGNVMIVGPLPDSPASRAGIRPGDVILEVDGQSTENMDLLEAVQLIRGPKGSTVVLTVLRAGDLQPTEVPVVRDTIIVTSVFFRKEGDDVGYIRVSAFDGKTVEETVAAIEELRGAGVEGLVLDLRTNSGGLVDAAVGVVSQFVREGLVCTGCNPGAEDDSREVTGSGVAYDIPLVVLVNSYSASASEIVAGALQDHDRAKVVGTTTFGKGSVNLLLELESGSGLYVTTGRWHTPKGRQIEGQGIEPDVVVGTGVDVQSAQRIGTLTQDLCQAYGEERPGLAEQEELVGALDGLCNLTGIGVDVPDTDEQLAAALSKLRAVMD